MDALIKELSEVHTLALNTNASNQNTFPLLKKHKIEQYFSVVKTRDDAPSKEDKSLQILEELNARPENTIFVSDSPGAIASGLLPVQNSIVFNSKKSTTRQSSYTGTMIKTHITIVFTHLFPRPPFQL